MNINDTFPSKYLKASDLKGQSVQVKISHVIMEQVQNDMLPVVYFLGATKGVVLNKTNANSISMAYGEETDTWGGSAMEVFPSTTEFGGKMVDCVRMRAVVNTPSGQAPADGSNVTSARDGLTTVVDTSVQQPAPVQAPAAPGVPDETKGPF